MKKFKMRAGIILLLILSMSLLSCKKHVGTTEDNAVVEEEEEKEEEVVSYTFGFSCISMDNPYFITLEAAIREELVNQGHTLITKDPALDATTQATQILEMIEEGVDAIFLSPVDWQEIDGSLQALKDAKVKIINVDTQVKDNKYVDAYIGSDNRNAGFICGQDLIERCPGGGKIVILECPTIASINDRITGFEEAIANQGFEVVARRDTKGDLNQSLTAAEEIFTEYDDVVAVMCGNDPSALGALVAANKAELKDIYIYGIDGSPDLKKELVKPGSLIAGTAAQSPISLGKTAADIGVKILNKEEYEIEILEPTFLINKSNVEMYGIDGWQ